MLARAMLQVGIMADKSVSAAVLPKGTFVESNDEIFLKTVMPSRKMTRKYLYDEEDQAG